MTWIDDAAHACARAGYAVGVTQTSDQSPDHAILSIDHHGFPSAMPYRINGVDAAGQKLTVETLLDRVRRFMGPPQEPRGYAEAAAKTEVAHG